MWNAELTEATISIFTFLLNSELRHWLLLYEGHMLKYLLCSPSIDVTFHKNLVCMTVSEFQQAEFE
ncbi:hypothetical protein SAMN04489841_1112 [Natrinema salaciae]|uniref:Uncharacterized protein n=1 Tax=Natrinema salaciae TaxID=1186196 RepID=A0A1H9CPB0_9EURY|nr:hypothetical protein SAMN04489841_1112 [Natrinema salaciae]